MNKMVLSVVALGLTAGMHIDAANKKPVPKAAPAEESYEDKIRRETAARRALILAAVERRAQEAAAQNEQPQAVQPAPKPAAKIVPQVAPALPAPKPAAKPAPKHVEVVHPVDSDDDFAYNPADFGDDVVAGNIFGQLIEITTQLGDIVTTRLGHEAETVQRVNNALITILASDLAVALVTPILMNDILDYMAAVDNTQRPGADHDLAFATEASIADQLIQMLEQVQARSYENAPVMAVAPQAVAPKAPAPGKSKKVASKPAGKKAGKKAVASSSDSDSEDERPAKKHHTKK